MFECGARYLCMTIQLLLFARVRLRHQFQTDRCTRTFIVLFTNRKSELCALLATYVTITTVIKQIANYTSPASPLQIALASVNAVQTGCVSDCFNKGNCSQNTQDPNQIWVMIIWLTARRAEKSVCPVLNVRVRTFSRRHTLIRVCDLWGWLH